MRAHLFPIALILAVSLSPAATRDKALDDFFQDAPLSHAVWRGAWRVARSKQPPGLRCTLTLPKDHYYVGEVIRASLIFSNETKAPWYVTFGSGGRSGRTDDVRFWAEDADGSPVLDPLEKYFGHSLRMGGGGPVDEKRVEPWEIRTTASQWVQFEKPGAYKLYAWTLRLSPGKQFESPEHGDPRVDLVTDPVEMTVDPLPAGYEKAILELANQALARPYKLESFHQTDMDDPDFKAVERLRFLQTPAARDLLLQFMDSNYWDEAKLGLLAAPDYAELEKKIVTGLRDGTVGLSEYLPYLYNDLKQVDRWMESPPAPQEKSWDALRDDLFAVARKAMKPDGHGRAFFTSLVTLFLQNPQDPVVRPIMIKRQLDLPQKQIDAAFYKESLRPAKGPSPLRDREFLPLLRELVKPEKHDPFALAALASLAPEEAKPIIVEDIKRARPLFLFEEEHVYHSPEQTIFALLSLPPKEMPELDSILQNKLAHPEANYLSHEALDILLQRYGIKANGTVHIQGLRLGGSN